MSCMLEPVNIFSKLLGSVDIVIGIAFAIFAHHALLYWGWKWTRCKRLAFGITGWGAAAVFIWQGLTLIGA